MSDLISMLDGIHPMSDALKSELIDKTSERRIAAREYLLKAGKICTHVHFIEKGLFRSYYDKEGKEVGMWFGKEGSLILVVDSFNDQMPSVANIQAIEDSVIVSLSYSDLESIYQRFPEFNLHGRLLEKHYHKLAVLDGFAIRSQTALERYQFMYETDLDLVLRVPDKYMAAYLGINHSTFSRTKKKFLKSRAW